MAEQTKKTFEEKFLEEHPITNNEEKTEEKTPEEIISDELEHQNNYDEETYPIYPKEDDDFEEEIIS